jgi:Cysteine protease
MWNSGFDGTADEGGNYAMATAYLARWSGPVSESSDPYDTPKKRDYRQFIISRK